MRRQEPNHIRAHHNIPGPRAPQLPVTPSDHERIRLAQVKRDNKAAKRAALSLKMEQA